MMVSFTEMGQTLGGTRLKAEMKFNFGYIKFAISFVIQMKISGRHLLESGSQGTNQN